MTYLIILNGLLDLPRLPRSLPFGCVALAFQGGLFLDTNLCCISNNEAVIKLFLVEVVSIRSGLILLHKISVPPLWLRVVGGRARLGTSHPKFDSPLLRPDFFSGEKQVWPRC
ncbi:hypothetical protein KFK09_021261 [Dendrobium nobile]|uniref:Uncharacterized protein n=1 Tax=Dendrobium nobile TaxID=94219 RepID=A0A8T3API5_DENNO|nr:hypothetical protein KFK09_021261 [Dendrobium nobile]